jgi:hypothetical protein
MTKNYNIQISPDIEVTPGTELFFVLEQVLPIEFLFREQNGIGIGVAGIINSDNKCNTYEVSSSSLSLLLPAELANESKKIQTEVEFADDPDVPFPFQGRRINTKLARTGSVLILHNNEKVLASNEQGAIWSVTNIDGIKRFRSALALPHISVEQNFNDVFNGECFMEMLVLLHFMREVCSNTGYQNAPLRANFIIDDPNLHWPRYGFADYSEIVAHAQKENYHVSFATIPLDTWFTHAATADLFRTNSRWISLLIHGNNHAKVELARNYSEEMRKGLLQQALRRIECLEQKANIHVCRVMVPPHGACSDEMLAELLMCGFESACISAGSLRAHNQEKPWVKTLGFFPAELIHGFPVLPRWGLTGNVKNTLLLAAYLGQPMILRGHHQDLKDGMELFDEYARFINGLGNVFWSNMTDLSRLNYQWRVEGATCYLKPLGRNITFELPNEVTEFIIESPRVIDDCAWQISSTHGWVKTIMPGECLFLSEDIGPKIFIEHDEMPQSASITTNLKPASVALFLRRLLTEARDRLLVF